MSDVESKVDKKLEADKGRPFRDEVFRADDVTGVAWRRNGGSGELINCSVTRFDRVDINHRYQDIRLYNVDQAKALAGAVQAIIDVFESD